MVDARVIDMRRLNSSNYGAVYTRPSSFRTSRTELTHLAAGISVFFIVEAPMFLQFGAIILAVLLIMSALAFALHELSHKFTAQYYGLWSEFRLDLLGTIISLFTALLPIKLIAPGTVVIYGSRVTNENMGKIALAGPLTNIGQILVFVFLSQFYPLFWLAVIVNADIAFFNLIPISILDGQKIFSWSKKAWLITFATAFILWIMKNIL